MQHLPYAYKPNGAEELSRILNDFFSVLVAIISASGGDIIKARVIYVLFYLYIYANTNIS